MVRLTVSRLEPIIWAMVWWVRRRVIRLDPASSARSRSSWATRPLTSRRTRLPTFSSTRRSRREGSRSNPIELGGGELAEERDFLEDGRHRHAGVPLGFGGLWWGKLT